MRMELRPKGIPDSEPIWVRMLDGPENMVGLITSDKLRTAYYLYEPKDDGWERVKEADDPTELEGLVYGEED